MLEKALVIRDLIRKLNKTFHHIATHTFANMGVTVPQLLVLREIKEQPRTIGQISKAVDLSYSTVSGVIDRLERGGLIERVRDKEDRRVIWIRKTEKVQEMMEKFPMCSDKFFEQKMAGLSEQEMDTIIHSLETILKKIE